MHCGTLRQPLASFHSSTKSACRQHHVTLFTFERTASHDLPNVDPCLASQRGSKSSSLGEMTRRSLHVTLEPQGCDCLLASCFKRRTRVNCCDGRTRSFFLQPPALVTVLVCPMLAIEHGDMSPESHKRLSEHKRKLSLGALPQGFVVL